MANTWVEVAPKKKSTPSVSSDPSSRARRRSDDRQVPPKFWSSNRSRSAFWHSQSRKEKKEIVDDWKAELSKSIKTKMIQPIDVPKDVQDAFGRYRAAAKAKKASPVTVVPVEAPTLETPETIALAPLALLKSGETTETCPEVVLVTSESTSKDESTAPANVKVIVPAKDSELTTASSDVVTRFKGVLQPLWMAFGCIVLVRLALVENSWLLCLPDGVADAAKKSTSAVTKLDPKKFSGSVPPSFELAGESLLTSHGKFDLPSVSSLPTYYAPELRPEAFIASIFPSL